MSNYIYKLENYSKIENIKNINILELGVQEELTNIFLEICDNNGGYLTSVDIDNCAKVSDNPRWKFIQSRDDNFDLIKNQFQKIDVIYLDTLHEAIHVEKVFL